MTDEERADRFHWFLFVFVLVFFSIVCTGTLVMVVGAEVKALGNSYYGLGQTAPLSKEAQIKLVGLSFVVTVSLSFTATLWSLQTGRLSKKLGLDWEDIIFGALCFQSEHQAIRSLGIFSWLYLLAFHAWFVLCAAAQAPAFVPGANCFSELATSHLSVLLTAPKAVLSILFLCFEGGSIFVVIWNLAVPAVQIGLTLILFQPVRAAAAPALCKALNRAVSNGNLITAKTIWDEAEVGEDIQLFQRMLPRLRFELDKLSEGVLEVCLDIAKMLVLEKDLAKWDLCDKKIGNSGAKVVAQALKHTATQELILTVQKALADGLKSNGSLTILDLRNNSIGIAGAEALRDGLKSNGSLTILDLRNNSIGDAGAEAPGLGCCAVEPRGGVAGPPWSCGQEGG
eukprot:s1434_g24.t2